MAARNGAYLAKMEFAGYIVTAIGESEGQAKEAIRKAVQASGYYTGSTFEGQSWAETWESLGGSVQWMKYGKAEWL